MRKQGKKADYVLRYTRDFSIAVVEANVFCGPDELRAAVNRLQVLLYAA